MNTHKLELGTSSLAQALCVNIINLKKNCILYLMRLKFRIKLLEDELFY